MHPYRTHTCGALRPEHAGSQARLSGWIHSMRDHGNLLFVDLRDHYGLTQCVVEATSPIFEGVEGLRLETVLTVTGPIEKRSDDTVNPDLPTGAVCSQNTDCRSNFCEANLGICIETCCSDGDCPSGTTCRLQYVRTISDRASQSRVCVSAPTEDVLQPQ